jgi:hypothetical protein
MTALEVYELALSYVFERKNQDAEYKEFFPSFLNTVMQEALPYENMIRRKSGKLALSSAPRITSADMDRELDFSEGLCRAALPYGVASFYCQDDGDNYRAQDYRTRFINALTDAAYSSGGSGAVIEDIEDVYGYGDATYN